MRLHDNSCLDTGRGFKHPQPRIMQSRSSPYWTWWFCSVALLLVAVGGCTAIRHTSPHILDREASYVLLPIVNHTETPHAGRRVEDITAALLHSRGLMTLRRYPATLLSEASPLSSDDRLLAEALEWAKAHDMRYAFTGAVEEWRYKVGIDGEPAVGISLQLVDLETDAVVWSAVGGKSGWSREAVSAVAQTLVDALLADLEFL